MRRQCVVAMAVAVMAAVLSACSSGGGDNTRRAARPNIVFVLTDDLSTNLLPYMPEVRKLARGGVTFSKYFVTDSLCCPSRASIFSGRFPHNTGIFSNSGPDGGFEEFRRRGEEADTFATDLHAAGYRTAMMGKYLNGYNARSSYVPPGWDQWAVGGDAGYGEFDYNLNENGAPVRYGTQPNDYLTDVLANKGVSFIKTTAADRQPFLLEIATFAPHDPYVPAPRHRDLFPGLQVPRTAAFNAGNPAIEPPWLAAVPTIGPAGIAQLNRSFRKRAQAVQAVDEMLGRLKKALDANGLANNTYIVFSSDNGYHMGEHRLSEGKMTAFDTDIRVPLIVAGPGVPSGRTVAQLTSNVDLRPTFDELAGVQTRPSVDGQSIGPLLHGHQPADWRTSILVEHHGPVVDTGDPDLPKIFQQNPPSYAAIRTTSSLYVEYVDGEREYYDVVRDPEELVNTAGQLAPDRQAALSRALSMLQACRDGPSCSAAQRPAFAAAAGR